MLHRACPSSSPGLLTCKYSQALALTLCALGSRELSTVRLGPLTTHSVRTLRHLRDFFGVTFNVAPDPDSQTVFLSCIGAGTKGLARRAA